MSAADLEAGKPIPPEETGEEGFFALPAGAPLDVLHVKTRREKVVEKALRAASLPHYLPLYRRLKRYRKGSAVHLLPLFGGYLFLLRDDARREALFPVSHHVISRLAVPEPDLGQLRTELDAVRALILAKGTVQPYEHLVPGRPVRVLRGPLKDCQGVVMREKGACRFIINVQFLGRSVSTEIDPVNLVAE